MPKVVQDQHLLVVLASVSPCFRGLLAMLGLGIWLEKMRHRTLDTETFVRRAGFCPY